MIARGACGSCSASWAGRRPWRYAASSATACRPSTPTWGAGKATSAERGAIWSSRNTRRSSHVYERPACQLHERHLHELGADGGVVPLSQPQARGKTLALAREDPLKLCDIARIKPLCVLRQVGEQRL